MLSGVVKSFNEDRGWGFIVPDGDPNDGTCDVFVHARSLSGIKLRRGQRVGFNVKKTDKGRRAVNVIVLLGESGQFVEAEHRPVSSPTS